MISTSVAPRSRARRSPSSSPRYSATLLVAVPRTSIASSRTSPSGEEITEAPAAGPGLPRAPPSTWTTTFNRGPDRRSGPHLLGVDAREVARDPRAAAVALFAPAVDRQHVGDLLLLALPRAAALFTGAPVGRAPVDDDLHVGVILVVLRELGIELVGELSRHHAIDHRRTG